MASTQPAYYTSATLHLWVEDELTREYLTALWPRSSVDINYLVAGGIAGVRAMSQHAKDHHPQLKVFGVVDRDATIDNEDKWADPAWPGVTYCPKVAEIENFLLDEVSMAAAPSNAAGLDEPALAAFLRGKAVDLEWWMTCKHTLATLNKLRNDSFPGDDLGKKARSVDDVVTALLTSTWIRDALPRLKHRTLPDAIKDEVLAAHEEVKRWLDGAAWRHEFSGKELFESVYHEVKGPRPKSSPEAFAQEIGRLQAQSGRVPPALAALEASIRRRAGLRP